MKVDNLLPIRLLTHNIRYATQSPFKGEEKWAVRKSRLINELSFNTTHCAESFICLQEVLYQQLLDILAALNSKKKAWAFVGVGRDDGLEAGEYSPICKSCFLPLLRSPRLGSCTLGTCSKAAYYPRELAILTVELYPVYKPEIWVCKFLELNRRKIVQQPTALYLLLELSQFLKLCLEN